MVEYALADARTWCRGRVIDDRPAFVHGVRVAVTVSRHVPDSSPDLIAAALLHDSPEVAPLGMDLDAVLNARYSREVTRIVRSLEAEHRALDAGNPAIDIEDKPVLLASTADKIVALTSLTRRADASGDPAGFFAARPALLELLPHFRAFHVAGCGRVPTMMTAHLGLVLNDLVHSARATA